MGEREDFSVRGIKSFGQEKGDLRECLLVEKRIQHNTITSEQPRSVQKRHGVGQKPSSARKK